MKSIFPKIILILALISTIFGCSPNLDNVAMFRGNLERTGFYNNINDHPPSGQLNWKFKPEYECYSSPVISDGVVYINCVGGNVYAVNTSSGQENWNFKREKWGGSSSIVSNGVVYVGGFDNYIYAIDTKGGLERWRFKTSNAIYSSPVISDGLVYVGSYDGYFYAIDIKTGVEKWKFATEGSKIPIPTEKEIGYAIIGSLGAIVSSPAISDGVVYFGSFDDYLYALDVNTGQEKWRYKTGGGIGSSPSISSGIVLFGSSDGYLYALDNDGQLKWKFNTQINAAFSSPYVSSAAIANGIAYITSTDTSDKGENNHLFAIDIKTGEMKWKTKTSLARYTSPTVSNDVVYFGDENGSVFSINGDTGQVEWQFNVESAVTSDVVIVDNLLYFCSKDGYLYSLR
jgi:outer membrane protein assembly factor BamB